MFNPQRKSKFVDILMEEKAFQLHLTKLNAIRHSSSPASQREQEEKNQERYLQRLHKSKQEVQVRLSSDLHKENHRMMQKLVETERRPEENPQVEIPHKRFNSYYNHLKESSRIKADNFGMVTRMLHQQSMVPTLSTMKSDFRQNKRYAKMVRKLPSILKHQQQFRRDLSSRRLSDSKASLSSSRREKSLGDRGATEDMRRIEGSLLSKKQ